MSILVQNETHDVNRQSWVVSANSATCEFPIQNLPFGVFRKAGSQDVFRVGVAIGDQILDLYQVGRLGLFSGIVQQALEACASPSLNQLMAQGHVSWSALRLALSRALESGSALEVELVNCLFPQSEAEYALPAQIGDYTDFYTSIHHATNVGKLFRPDNPLLPNYKWVPIGYHGRASSVVISGQDFARPNGQTLAPGAQSPTLTPCKRLDIELEMGVFIGAGNNRGDSISIEAAEDHVFGLCLLNDWSARDIQAWEYQPLGPFLSKSFATSISPWVVTLEALAPYRVALERAAEDPQPLAYLNSASNTTHGAFDIELEVLLQTEQMRNAGLAPEKLIQTNYRHAYWTVAQMVAHHTINGCNLQSGDLFGTGTLSGPTLDQAGALLEITEGGKSPITLANGQTRTFLEDGDEVTLRGWCQHQKGPRIGFGTCIGRVLPAIARG